PNSPSTSDIDKSFPRPKGKKKRHTSKTNATMSLAASSSRSRRKPVLNNPKPRRPKIFDEEEPEELQEAEQEQQEEDGEGEGDEESGGDEEVNEPNEEENEDELDRIDEEEGPGEVFKNHVITPPPILSIPVQAISTTRRRRTRRRRTTSTTFANGRPTNLPRGVEITTTVSGTRLIIQPSIVSSLRSTLLPRTSRATFTTLASERPATSTRDPLIIQPPNVFPTIPPSILTATGAPASSQTSLPSQPVPPQNQPNTLSTSEQTTFIDPNAPSTSGQTTTVNPNGDFSGMSKTNEPALSLKSAGGIALFTILSILIIAAAVALFVVVSRRRNNDKRGAGGRVHRGRNVPPPSPRPGAASGAFLRSRRRSLVEPSNWNEEGESLVAVKTGGVATKGGMMSPSLVSPRRVSRSVTVEAGTSTPPIRNSRQIYQPVQTMRDSVGGGMEKGWAEEAGYVSSFSWFVPPPPPQISPPAEDRHASVYTNVNSEVGGRYGSMAVHSSPVVMMPPSLAPVAVPPPPPMLSSAEERINTPSSPPRSPLPPTPKRRSTSSSLEISLEPFRELRDEGVREIEPILEEGEEMDEDEKMYQEHLEMVSESLAASPCNSTPSSPTLSRPGSSLSDLSSRLKLFDRKESPSSTVSRGIKRDSLNRAKHESLNRSKRESVRAKKAAVTNQRELATALRDALASRQRIAEEGGKEMVWESARWESEDGE
ncbi:hypothetical protein HDU67_001707, partial [Dinochytrium kinnereticum]